MWAVKKIGFLSWWCYGLMSIYMKIKAKAASFVVVDQGVKERLDFEVGGVRD